MLAGRTERAAELADRALEVARAVGAEAARASALITKATSRANAGDYENVREDLEEARRLTTEYDPTEVSRAYVNLSSLLLDFGELADAIAVAREGLAHNVRAGTAGGTGGFALGNLCEACFFAGQWEEAEAIANAELDRARKVGGLYYEPFFRFILAELGLVRSGRVDEAVAAVRLGSSSGTREVTTSPSFRASRRRPGPSRAPARRMRPGRSSTTSSLGAEATVRA